MNTQLTVVGMHCDACKALITMELEEHKLDQYVSAINLNMNETGTLEITTDDEELVKQIRSVIDGLDSYSVSTSA